MGVPSNTHTFTLTNKQHTQNTHLQWLIPGDRTTERAVRWSWSCPLLPVVPRLGPAEAGTDEGRWAMERTELEEERRGTESGSSLCLVVKLVLSTPQHARLSHPSHPKPNVVSLLRAAPVLGVCRVYTLSFTRTHAFRPEPTLFHHFAFHSVYLVHL